MFYIEVLQFLSERGLYVKTDIVPIFKGYNDLEEMLKFLQIAEAQNHINIYEIRTKTVINQYGGQTPGMLMGVQAEMTFSGMDYLMKHSVAEKTKNGIKNQFRTQIITIVLLFISTSAAAIATYLTYISNKQSNIEQQQLSSLKKDKYKLLDSIAKLNRCARLPTNKKP